MVTIKENEKVYDDIFDLMELPEEYHSISVPKLNIADQIKLEMDRRKISIRKLAKDVGLKHPQIIRITRSNNYNIDTLLKILDGLDLEIEIRSKKNI